MSSTNQVGNNLVNPFTLDAADGYEWLKGNLHSHTTNSDGAPSPQERLDGYVSHDYDFLCLSDHDRITRVDSVSCPPGFVLIPGAELHPDNAFGGQLHHFLCLNVTEDMPARQMPAQHVIDTVNGQGGAVWLAHPHWSGVMIYRDTAPLKGLIGIEVFNTICGRRFGRPESGVHWDDWMSLENKLYPALANDDAHARGEDNVDTYVGWTMARTKERTTQAVFEALCTGACYASTGPEIHDVKLQRTDLPGNQQTIVELHIRCSEAQAINAVCDIIGNHYREGGQAFTEATFSLQPDSRWVRLEVVGMDGSKAWTNPFDLTALERDAGEK